jgi:signal transduction histidine kinase
MALPEEKVLLVDDEPRHLDGLGRRLSDRFHILTADSAGEAIQRLEAAGNVGAVVAGLAMPERDGVDLLTVIGRRWPNIRRLMLADHEDQETAMAAVARGRVFRFFHKPCDTDQLALALNEALDEFRFVNGHAAGHEALEIRARASARSRKVLLSTIGHDLLTPLNHILGFTAMLEMKLRGKDEADALDYLTHIKDSGEALLRLVQRALEIARYTSGDPGRARRLTDVAAVVEEELKEFRARADLKQLAVSYQSPQEPVFACTNEYELRFALRELLDNASKFNRPDGLISVAVCRDGGMLAIRIADTGTGMTADTVRRAFGSFDQEDASLSRRFSRVGLGLTFAAFYARANKGRLSVESARHAGTAVMVTLPAAEHPPEFARIA